MRALPFLLIFITLITFVTGQLLFKRAMDNSNRFGFGRPFLRFFIPGIASMTVSFFLTLGLLQRFDLSFIYPFQGLSVMLISVAAIFLLKEKWSGQLLLGSLLITVGVILVSFS